MVTYHRQPMLHPIESPRFVLQAVPAEITETLSWERQVVDHWCELAMVNEWLMIMVR